MLHMLWEDNSQLLSYNFLIEEFIRSVKQSKISRNENLLVKSLKSNENFCKHPSLYILVELEHWKTVLLPDFPFIFSL